MNCDKNLYQQTCSVYCSWLRWFRRSRTVMCPARVVEDARNRQTWSLKDVPLLPAISFADRMWLDSSILLPVSPLNPVRAKVANFWFGLICLVWSDRAVTSMTTIATATALGVVTNYPLGSNAITCNFLQGSSCPLSANEDVTYRLTMPILSIYPLVSLSIEIDLIDQNNNSVSCFVVDAQVVTASKWEIASWRLELDMRRNVCYR